jgi:hypothetical protein
MPLNITNDFDALCQKLELLPKRLVQKGQKWASESAKQTAKQYKENLETQGRPGGYGEPISEFTKQNPSDGSGIRDHIKTSTQRSRNKVTAKAGITDDRAAMIARVQDQGTTIQVTEDMSGYLQGKGLNVQPGDHIEIPGRKSWERAVNESARSAKKDLMLYKFLLS